MVQELTLLSQEVRFPDSAPAAYPVFFRTYSRKYNNKRESWAEVCDRTLAGLKTLGKLTNEQTALIDKMQKQLKSLTSGRWLWVGGTEWVDRPENFSGSYNCTSTNVIDWRSFGLMMDLAMQGSGTGGVLEPQYISQLPVIRNQLQVNVVGAIGDTPTEKRRHNTEVQFDYANNAVKFFVGDSRQGWVKSYQSLLELCSDEQFDAAKPVQVTVDISDVRPSGEALKGFGGMANPVKLPTLYDRCANILNKAIGRQLTSVECCILIDEAAVCIVAGNIRRSAGMRQFSSEDALGSVAKDNLWQQDEAGNWRIDPERDALRMANHTRVFHRKPTEQECVDAVRKQYYSGEGAIQWAGEAIARSNADLITTPELKRDFLSAYVKGEGKEWLRSQQPEVSEHELEHRLQRYALNPCLTADTWVHTEHGARQISDLIGKQVGVYVNGELFSTTADGFFLTGNKPVMSLQTKEGFALRLTDNHQLLKVTAQTQHAQYTEWVETKDLQIGDRILLHDHRKIQPWDGEGSFEEGWLIGNLCAENSLANLSFLSFEGDSREKMAAYAATLLSQTVGFSNVIAPDSHSLCVVMSERLPELASKFGLTNESKLLSKQIERASYKFYCGFLRGLFDLDATVTDKESSVLLSGKTLDCLEVLQRMLARLGVISKIYKQKDSLKDTNFFSLNLYDLSIDREHLHNFEKRIGFQEPQKKERLQSLMPSSKCLANMKFTATITAITPDGIEPVYDCTVPQVSRFDANGIVAHNCGEILGADFHCNLSEVHLNLINPKDEKEQEAAFKAGALSVASLLNHQFIEKRYQFSRDVDPIVGVSFTGLFDFFVHAFGVEWLRWFEAGRPDTVQGLDFKEKEADYLNRWREIVHQTVWEYCDSHDLRRPNRCTTTQPAGTKSLLTGASPGWHPPKAQRFIRRITFRKDDPVARACMDYGYSIIPSQSDKDENGQLLNDPFDPRCTEWLVEIPVSVSWADLDGADMVDISKFDVMAQFDFYMQVQKFYTRHNTSATLELREHEIEPLGKKIYEAIRDDEGYISAALLARFDDLQTFPRLPFEPIDKATYEKLSAEVLVRRKSDDFYASLLRYDSGELMDAGPAGCDSDKCMFPEQKP
jgi:ribonucleotide reductase class II